MHDYLLITNSAAGSAEDDAVEAARAVLASAGAVEVAATESPEELDDVLAALGRRTVVVAGGDGSLHAVVNALHRLDLLGSATLGLVPLGTGNDFARGVGLPLDAAEAAQVIVASAPVATDLVLDSAGTTVVNSVHLGLGADAARAGESWKPRLGRLGYAVGALIAGLRPEFIRVTVTVDGQPVHAGRVVQVAIGNGAYVGGGTELVPGADPASGSLTVIVSRATGPLTRLAYAARLRRGEHHRMREVLRVRGSSVEVSGEAFWLSTDGEITGPHTRHTWTARPGALRMHRPHDM